MNQNLQPIGSGELLDAVERAEVRVEQVATIAYALHRDVRAARRRMGGVR
jgi:hypothetical protein